MFLRFVFGIVFAFVALPLLAGAPQACDELFISGGMNRPTAQKLDEYIRQIQEKAPDSDIADAPYTTVLSPLISDMVQAIEFSFLRKPKTVRPAYFDDMAANAANLIYRIAHIRLTLAPQGNEPGSVHASLVLANLLFRTGVSPSFRSDILSKMILLTERFPEAFKKQRLLARLFLKELKGASKSSLLSPNERALAKKAVGALTSK